MKDLSVIGRRVAFWELVKLNEGEDKAARRLLDEIASSSLKSVQGTAQIV